MKHALISKNEQVEQGYRVAQVQPETQHFEISDAGDMFWVDAPDDVTPDTHWFDPNDESFKLIPKPALDATAEARANDLISEFLSSIS